MEIIKIPDKEKEFRKFCEEWGWACFGNTGRRAWIGDLSTYLRGDDYVIQFDSGNYVTCDLKDIKDLSLEVNKFLNKKSEDNKIKKYTVYISYESSGIEWKFDNFDEALSYSEKIIHENKPANCEKLVEVEIKDSDSKLLKRIKAGEK